MLGRVFAVAFLLALAAFVVEDRLIGSRIQAQEPVGAEVRLAAQEDRSGSTSVGLQYRVSGKWRFLAPTRNVLPATAAFDRWYTSSGIEVEVAQARAEIGVHNRAWSSVSGPDQFTITIGDKRYVARCGLLLLTLINDGLELQTGTRDCQDVVTVGAPELTDPTSVGPQVLRIAARRLLNGGIEMGLQRLIDGQWEEMRQQTRRVLSRFSGTVWRFTPVVELPRLSGHVSGQLRRGVSISTRDGEFDLEVDGRVYRSRCGVLELDILAEHILVDTRDDDCQQRVPLLTICPTSRCDVQQNAAYAWESRQIGSTLDSIELTLPQARAVVNALFDDYFPPFDPPRVSFSNEQEHGHGSRSEIVLGTRTRNLGAAVHELAHALVDRSNARDVGHGGAFMAMLLDIWERYFPIVDVESARDDARRSGLEVASTVPARPVRSEAVDTLSALLCAPRQVSIELCFANLDVMPSATDESLAGGYVGSGSSGEDLWWSAQVDSISDGLESYVAMEVELQEPNGFRARLQISCTPDDGLDLEIWWRYLSFLPSVVSVNSGAGEAVEQRWSTGRGSWGGDYQVFHESLAVREDIREMGWAAVLDNPWSISFIRGGERFHAEFAVQRLFATPVQRNLAQCESSSRSSDDTGLIIDSGRFGDDFWWGVDDNEDPLETYVVMDTTISGTAREARLSVNCKGGGLGVDIYWEVELDLDWTVLYRINSDGAVQSEDWSSGTGSWTDIDIDYKWTGREDAADLISELHWAAQAGGTFTVEVREHNNPNRRYTGTWNLDGLFDTPVQPNLARCGR